MPVYISISHEKLDRKLYKIVYFYEENYPPNGTRHDLHFKLNSSCDVKLPISVGFITPVASFTNMDKV